MASTDQVDISVEERYLEQITSENVFVTSVGHISMPSSADVCDDDSAFR